MAGWGGRPLLRVASSAVIKQVAALFEAGTNAGLSDGRLLERFVTEGPEEAEASFASLVERHGPMVMHVCRRVLRNGHDAEDAAQATFLVLARRARSIRRMDSIASWLYGVAWRVAARTRREADRRRARERRSVEASMTLRRTGGDDPEAYRELYDALDRIPERFRLPILLCHLEGLTYEQAAERLGCPVRTVQSRLARGRKRLHDRLSRQGVGPAVAPLAGILNRDASSAFASESWGRATVQAAVGYATGGAHAATVSATVAAIAQGATRSMTIHRLTKWAAFASMLGLAGAAALPWLLFALGSSSNAAPPTQGKLSLRVLEEGGGTPVEGAEVGLRADKHTQNARTDAQGVCTLDVPSPPPSYFNVSIKKQGFVPASVSWERRGERAASIPAEQTVALQKGTTIGGIVQDDRGRPIGGATVFVLVPINERREPGVARPSIWDYEVKTDAEGRWRCDVVPAKLDDVWLRLNHPDFAGDRMYGDTPKPTLEKLRDLSGVMVMKKGIAVSGRVLAADGSPVAGAKVAQGADRFGSHYPETKSDDQGRFRFENVRPGEMILTVQAKGHGPDLKRLAVGKESVDVEFRLEPPHRIGGRVVDSRGGPVAGAFVAADTWRGRRSLEFRVDTDEDGRFAWEDAPGDEVLFDLGKQGFMSVRQKTIKASDEEVTITLLKPLKVGGSVVDDETGKPVEAFTVTPGIDWGNGRAPYWELQSARRQSSGRYEFEFGEPRHGHLVRIEADGYLPVNSPMFKDDQGEVAFDARLKKGEGPSGVVIGPGGKPVKGASVCLVTAGAGAYLTNARPPDRRDSPVVETDDAGRFRFPAQQGKFAVVALHDLGYAMVKDAELAKSSDVKLEAWGRVEGTVRIGSRPGAGESVRLSVRQEGRGDEPQPYFDYRTTADSGGRFAFERVRPGKVDIAREVKLSDRMTGYSHSTPIEVGPGATVRGDLGGTGRPVVGRVVAPGGEKIDLTFGQNSLRAALPQPDVPKGLTNEEKAEWYEAWTKTPEGKAYAEGANRNFTVKVEGDGSFRVEDVPAGDYEVNIAINEPPVGNACGIGGDLLASARRKFTIPAMEGGRSDEPLDVGTIELAMTKRVKVGDQAPGFEVAALGEGVVKLDDFRGKFVLLDFWATWCGPCAAETPHLKSAFEAYRDDDRFAMIGLSLDQDKEAPRKYVDGNALGWRQAFLGNFGEAKLPNEYGVRGIPSIWLIGPDGRVIAKDLRGDAIKEAVGKALSSAK